VILGATFERNRDRTGASIVVLTRRGESIYVLSSEVYQVSNLLECARKVIDSINDCPEKIDEIMAGNRETLEVLHHCLRSEIRLNEPRKRPPCGEHIIASIDRLRGRW
jgi:hypothetical protein